MMRLAIFLAGALFGAGVVVLLAVAVTVTLDDETGVWDG